MPRTARACPAIAAALTLAACGGADQTAQTANPDPQTPPAPAIERGDAGPASPWRETAQGLVRFSQLTPPSGPDAPALGDVESQTGAALRVLDERLNAAGLTRGNLVHLTIHVVPGADGAIDETGVGRALRRAFDTPIHPAAPARALIGVAALPGEGVRVSIDATAERPALPDAPDETDAP